MFSFFRPALAREGYTYTYISDTTKLRYTSKLCTILVHKFRAKKQGEGKKKKKGA